MKKLLLLTLLLFSINGFAVNWKKVAENEKGSHYLDVDSIKKHDGLIHYVDLVDFLEPFMGSSSAISKYKVDCKDEKQTWLNLTTYSQSMGKGKINSESTPNEIIYPKSNTVYFLLIKNVCSYKK